MKQQLLRGLLLLTLTLTALMGFSQAPPKPFEGSVFYNIRVSGPDAQAFLLDEPCNKLNLHIKDNNYIVHLFGGQKPKSFLFIGDSNHTYIVDAANKRYFLRDYYRDTTKTVPEAKPTGDTVQVKGIKCAVYVMVNGPVKTTFYVSNALRVDVSKFAGLSEANPDFLIKGLDGRVPLKKVIEEPGLTKELEVAKYELKPLDAENFVIPADFVRKVRDHR